jgi:hypothetical protein
MVTPGSDTTLGLSAGYQEHNNSESGVRGVSWQYQIHGVPSIVLQTLQLQELHGGVQQQGVGNKGGVSAVWGLQSLKALLKAVKICYIIFRAINELVLGVSPLKYPKRQKQSPFSNYGCFILYQTIYFCWILSISFGTKRSLSGNL